MREEDAQIFFHTKIDWTAVYSNNKLYCAEHRCDFSTTIDNEDLANHLIKEGIPLMVVVKNFLISSKWK